jgi:hypothetical protein
VECVKDGRRSPIELLGRDPEDPNSKPLGIGTAEYRPAGRCLLPSEARHFRHAQAQETTAVNIDIQVTVRQPPSGVVSTGDDEPRPFTGWLQLLKILSDALAEAEET